MNNREDIKSAIQSVIKKLMDNLMKKVLVDDPFIEEKHKADKPLYAALVPNEVFKGSHFERRFVTPFGKIWEQLAAVAAQAGSGRAVVGHPITGNVDTERLRRIQKVLDQLEHAEGKKEKVKPSWDKELAYILEGHKGEPIPVTVICDVYVDDSKTNKKFAFELKAPLPKSDQTKVSKEKILKLYSMLPIQIDDAFFALPYNPYGSRDKYIWPFPSRWFDMKHDATVLIGDEFWEKIGGTGTYRAFIDAVNEIGLEYRIRIYREYLGIEPPPSSISTKL